MEAAELAGRSLLVYQYISDWLLESGYVNVQEKSFKTPMGGSWCSTESERELGKWNAVNLLEGIEGFTMALLTRYMRWHPIEVHAFLGTVRMEIQEQKVHSYYRT